MDDPLENIAYLARSPNRVGVLAALEEAPRTRRDLADVLGASRATLARVLGEFEDRRWVERSGDHYLVTELGEFVYEEFAPLVETMDAVGTLQKVVHLLPTNGDLGLRAFADARVITPDPTDPTAHMDIAFDHVATADRVDIFATTAVPRLVAQAAERLREEEFSFTATIPATYTRELSPGSTVLAGLHDIATEGGAVRLTEEPIEHNLVIADDTVALWLCDEEGTDQGLLVTDDYRVREWAASRIERHDPHVVSIRESTVAPDEE